jgi:hypothetical protein
LAPDKPALNRLRGAVSCSRYSAWWKGLPIRSGANTEAKNEGNKGLAMTLAVVHVSYMENPLKSRGISLTEVFIALVALGLFVAMFAWAVDLRQLIQ